MDPKQPLPSLPVDLAQQPVNGLPPVSQAVPATNSQPIDASVLPGLSPAGPVADDKMSAINPSPVAGQPQKHSPHAPATAEDVDLIEKEWVVKAKQIINSTSGNPNQQSSEISRFKADYLKTRYSKDLKVSDQ